MQVIDAGEPWRMAVVDLRGWRRESEKRRCGAGEEEARSGV